MITANYNQPEIYSPNRKYVALLHESKKGYVVCPVGHDEEGENIDTDYRIGWISHTVTDAGFYLDDVTVTNFKVNLIELQKLLCLCCNGHDKIEL